MLRLKKSYLVIQNILVVLLCLIVIQQSLLGQSLQEISRKVDNWNRAALYDSSYILLNKQIQNTKNVDVLGFLHLKLGKTYNYQEYLLKTFQNYSQAETYFKTNNNIEGLAKVYVAFIEFNRKSHTLKACDYYFNKLENFIKAGKISKLTTAEYYSRRAAVEQESTRNSKKTRAYSHKVVVLAKELNNYELLASAYNEISGTYEEEKNYDLAKKYLKLSLQYYTKVGNYLYMTYELNSLGRVEGKLKNFSASKVYLLQGIRYAEKYNFNSQKIYLYSILRDIYAIEKNFKDAYDLQIKYDNVRYVIENETSNKILKELEEKYNLEKQIDISNNIRIRAKRSENEVIAKKNQAKLLLGFTLILILLICVIAILALRLKRRNRQLYTVNSDLNETLSQKDILFRELHHRVKNNLSILKSILFFQAKSSAVPEVKLALNDSMNRIESMSLVHENLYDANDVSRVELKSFIEQLLFKLKSSLLIQREDLKIEVDEKVISMPISTAIFIGFIINELFTNSVKYGMSEGDRMRVGVNFIETAEGLTIEYWDNGKGLGVENINFQNGGFGFRLIEIMMKQLKSRIVYSVEGETPTFRFSVSTL